MARFCREEEDDTASNHIAGPASTQKLTRRRLRGIHQAVGSPLQDASSEGRKPAQFRGVRAANSGGASQAVGDEGPLSRPDGDTAVKNCVVVVSVVRDGDEAEGKSKDTVGGTEGGMADEDEDMVRSCDSSMQDESSLASATDSQASSSDGERMRRALFPRSECSDAPVFC